MSHKSKKKSSNKDNTHKTTKKQSDQASDTTIDTIAEKINPAVQHKAQELLGKADEVAHKVDEMVEHVDEFAENFLPHSSGSSATFNVQWSPTISRVFVFRFLWLIIEIFVIGFRGVWIGILSVVHVLYMLVFGKRERNIWNRQVRYWNHVVKWESYLMCLSDERPDIVTPE